MCAPGMHTYLSIWYSLVFVSILYSHGERGSVLLPALTSSSAPPWWRKGLGGPACLPPDLCTALLATTLLSLPPGHAFSYLFIPYPVPCLDSNNRRERIRQGRQRKEDRNRRPGLYGPGGRPGQTMVLQYLSLLCL